MRANNTIRTRMRRVRHGARASFGAGFTLLEVMIVLAVILVVAAISIPNVARAMRDAQVANGYETAYMTIRRAREASVAERRVYIVTITAPSSISVVAQNPDATSMNIAATLPNGIAFSAEPGLPNTVATTPDHLPINGAPSAVCFDVGVTVACANQIYFYPDGTSRDINGNSNSGLLYIARPGDLMSSRAITVWGTSGRIRGWRLGGTPALPSWSMQ